MFDPSGTGRNRLASGFHLPLCPPKEVQENDLTRSDIVGIVNNKRARARQPTGTLRIIKALHSPYALWITEDSGKQGINDGAVRETHIGLQGLEIPQELRRECVASQTLAF